MTANNSKVTSQQVAEEPKVNLIRTTQLQEKINNISSKNRDHLRTVEQIIETRKAKLIRFKRVRKQKKTSYFILINSIKKTYKIDFW